MTRDWAEEMAEIRMKAGTMTPDDRDLLRGAVARRRVRDEDPDHVDWMERHIEERWQASIFYCRTAALVKR